MIPGISGSLLSEDALEHLLPDALKGLLGETERSKAHRRLHRWHAPLRSVLGPASGPRTLFDRLAAPLLSQLGYRVLPDGDGPAGTLATHLSQPRALRGLLQSQGRTTAALIVTGWGWDAAGAWRDAVRQGIGHGVRWCFCCTGPALRVVDSERTYSRRFVEFDLETALESDATFRVFWGLLRADAMLPRDADVRPLLERAIAISEDHRASVRTSLQRGVNEALLHLSRAFAIATRSRRRRHTEHATGQSTFDEALIVIYRVLFLLFAEARGLVPRWHPVYRDGYTIEALRSPIELLPRPRGLWETMQSIARLAHRGCRIGSLHVTPFNGRLFSPSESPLADTVRLDDGAVRQALLSLTTRQVRGGRERIAYGDLGVEQLGGVYERVLDLEPVGVEQPARQPSRVVRNTRRKRTGSFYTPRSLTEYLVRRTLAPLVQNASPEQILSLRILDPAMGSGAFLVAVCRYLASAYEAALLREGTFGVEDIDETERADFRRSVAQRCLYGVDINPMAVQLGRLSLWLATLAADRPLTFLDHRLRAGNSLVGASLADLARQPPGGRRRTGHWTRPLPLFDDQARDEELRRAIATRDAIAVEPGNTLADVRAKERALARLSAADTPLARWKDACDLWCAWWFWPPGAGSGRPSFGPFMDSLLGRGSLPAHVAGPVLENARKTAARERFFHWTFEFPEVFGACGVLDGNPGFDAIVSNPPWEMLRSDAGTRETAGTAQSTLVDFARGSGIYSLQGSGHANLYQGFLERMFQLLRRGGRLGVILPSGLATDHGAAPLRRVLLKQTAIDTLVSFENTDALFPIHRSLKFLLLSATTGGSTPALPCRFGVRRQESLETLPESGPHPEAVIVPRLLLEKLSRDDLSIPDIRCSGDVDLLSHLVFTIPALGSADGWNVAFGRELNATDDRKYFHAARTSDAESLPVVEGKQLSPFAVDVESSKFRISARDAGRLLDPDRTFRRWRLAYRDVASATNRLTLIAALVPAGTVTTHTLFCLKDPLDDADQYFLCGMFNSFVANYFVRLQVGTHVTTTIVGRLPMPKPPPGSRAFKEIVDLTVTLGRVPSDGRSYARLQAVAARLYELDEAQFCRVLETLPLVSRADRDAARSAFCDIVV